MTSRRYAALININMHSTQRRDVQELTRPDDGPAMSDVVKIERKRKPATVHSGTTSTDRSITCSDRRCHRTGVHSNHHVRPSYGGHPSATQPRHLTDRRRPRKCGVLAETGQPQPVQRDSWLLRKADTRMTDRRRTPLCILLPEIGRILQSAMGQWQPIDHRFKSVTTPTSERAPRYLSTAAWYTALLAVVHRTSRHLAVYDGNVITFYMYRTVVHVALFQTSTEDVSMSLSVLLQIIASEELLERRAI